MGFEKRKRKKKKREREVRRVSHFAKLLERFNPTAEEPCIKSSLQRGVDEANDIIMTSIKWKALCVTPVSALFRRAVLSFSVSSPHSLQVHYNRNHFPTSSMSPRNRGERCWHNRTPSQYWRHHRDWNRHIFTLDRTSMGGKNVPFVFDTQWITKALALRWEDCWGHCQKSPWIWLFNVVVLESMAQDVCLSSLKH